MAVKTVAVPVKMEINCFTFENRRVYTDSPLKTTWKRAKGTAVLQREIVRLYVWGKNFPRTRATAR
jgi:hypothetical protein